MQPTVSTPLTVSGCRRIFPIAQPLSNAYRCAAGPQSSVGLSCNNLAATVIGLGTSSRPATAPTFRLRPSIMEASIDTFPYLETDPVPALKIGSSSSARIIASAASSALLFRVSATRPADSAAEQPFRLD